MLLDVYKYYKFGKQHKFLALTDLRTQARRAIKCILYLHCHILLFLVCARACFP